MGAGLRWTLAVLARAALAEDEHVHLRMSTVGDALGARGLDDFGGHAGPAQGSAFHAIGRRDHDRGSESFDSYFLNESRSMIVDARRRKFRMTIDQTQIGGAPQLVSTSIEARVRRRGRR